MAARVVCSCGWTRIYKNREHAEFNARRRACPTAARRADRRYRCARCGFIGEYPNATAAAARKWFDGHSCQRWERKMLSAARAEQRETLVDRTPKPCHHKKANHQHGTRACYVLDRCRCQPCSKANSDAETSRERQKAYGRYNKYVNAMPVREHVAELRAAGMGLKTIAKRSGVAHGALWKLVYGKKLSDGSQTPSRRVLRETAEKLYALDPTWSEQPLALADGAILSMEDSAPTFRRLQSLVCLGWSMSALGRRLGIQYGTNVIPIVKGERRVTVGTARKTEQLFDQLCMTLPPETNQRERIAAARSRRLARENGWLPPLALEDLGVDAASADELDEQAMWRREHGDTSVHLTRAERLELVRRLHSRGLSDGEIATQTGYAMETAFRIRKSLGLPSNVDAGRNRVGGAA